MKQVKKTLWIVAMALLVTPVTAGATDEEAAKLAEYEKEYYTTQETELVYEFIDEELVGNELVRTYREKGVDRDVWSIIAIPEEILKEAQKEKTEEKKINKIYEELTKLYTKEEAWYRLNILTHQKNEMYPVTDVNITETAKKEAKKNLEIVKKQINKPEQPILISKKSEYTDELIVEEMKKNLEFKNKDEANEILGAEIEELKTDNIFVKMSLISLILAIMGVIVVKIRRRGGDNYEHKK